MATTTKPETFLNIQEVRGIGFSERQLRREYARLRAIAEKRIKRMSNTVFSQQRFYQRYKTGFLKTSEIAKGDLIYELRDVARFLTSPYSTISGSREALQKKIKKAAKHGYYGELKEGEEFKYNKEEEAKYLDFFNFLREIEDLFGELATYDSDTVAKMYRRGMSRDEVAEAFRLREEAYKK